MAPIVVWLHKTFYTWILVRGQIPLAYPSFKAIFHGSVGNIRPFASSWNNASNRSSGLKGHKTFDSVFISFTKLSMIVGPAFNTSTPRWWRNDKASNLFFAESDLSQTYFQYLRMSLKAKQQSQQSIHFLKWLVANLPPTLCTKSVVFYHVSQKQHLLCWSGAIRVVLISNWVPTQKRIYSFILLICCSDFKARW